MRKRVHVSDTHWGLTDPVFADMDYQSRAIYFRTRLWLRDKGMCGICGMYVQLARFQMDHVIQKSEDGPDTWDNLRTTHRYCNDSRVKVYRPRRVWTMPAPPPEVLPPSAALPVHRQSTALTVEEAAGRIGTHANTIRRWLRDGRLKGVKPGGDKIGYRIPATEVDRLLGLPVIEGGTRG